MKALEQQTKAELERNYEREGAIGRKLGDRMIAEGRGSERPSETRQKSDPLSREFNAHLDRHNALVAEMRRRETYHGSLHRTAKAKWL